MRNGMEKHRVLIVEDEAPLVSLLVRTFSEEGFEVATAGDGIDCMNKVATFLPDVIIMDIMMPKLDGIDATRLLRWNREYADTLIVALSARSDHEIREQMRKAGADLYMTKPFVISHLVERVKELLEVRAGLH